MTIINFLLVFVREEPLHTAAVTTHPQAVTLPMPSLRVEIEGRVGDDA